MKTFIRKRQPVKAIQFRLADWAEICDTVGVPKNGYGIWATKPGTTKAQPSLFIRAEALGGWQDATVYEGDWILWDPDHEGYMSVIEDRYMQEDYEEVKDA